jgi:hypothetical protein
MPTITLDISEEEDKDPEVEFGLPSSNYYGTNVQVMFNNLTLEMSYEQAENLYNKLKPFFEVSDEDTS